MKTAPDSRRTPSPDEQQREDLNPYEQLLHRALGHIFHPINAWIRGLSRLKAFFLLLMVMLVAVVARFEWESPNLGGLKYRFLPYYWSAHPDATPHLKYEIAPVASDLSSYISAQLAPQLRGTTDGLRDSWTEAQMIVSADPLNGGDSHDIVKWFDAQMSPCFCWRQHRNREEDHVGATGWVLLAFARLHHAPSCQQIDFMLRTQHVSSGWWPMFPSSDEEKNASTYATAMSVWSLSELMRLNLIVDSEQRAAVAMAVRQGRIWLVTHNIPDQARWKDYQAQEFGKISLGLSGLVMHVLHKLQDPAALSFDRFWMADLPSKLPPVDDRVTSYFPVAFVGGSFFQDTTNNFTTPWLLIATSEAYRHGSWRQRAAGIRLFEQIRTDREAIRHSVQGLPWFAAEMLMALRYVQGDQII